MLLEVIMQWAIQQLHQLPKQQLEIIKPGTKNLLLFPSKAISKIQPYASQLS